MSVNLQKGGNVSLTKVAAEAGIPLQNVVVACGWDANKKKRLFGHEYDLDLSCAGTDISGTVPANDDPTDRGYQNWFIHANHRHDAAGSVTFMGDNRTGSGDGDDEEIKVDLSKIPRDIAGLVFGVVIWRAEERKQKFGDVQNAFIRIYDEKTGQEFARFDLGNDFSEETFVIFGELYRYSGDWKFRAIGQGYPAATYRRAYNIRPAFETDYARYND